MKSPNNAVGAAHELSTWKIKTLETSGSSGRRTHETFVLSDTQDGTTAGHSVTASPGKAPWRSQPSVVDPGAPSKHFSASSCCHVPGAGTLASRAPPTRRLNPEDLASMLGYLPNMTLPDSRQCCSAGGFKAIYSTGLALHPASGVRAAGTAAKETATPQQLVGRAMHQSKPW